MSFETSASTPSNCVIVKWELKLAMNTINDQRMSKPASLFMLPHFLSQPAFWATM